MEMIGRIRRLHARRRSRSMRSPHDGFVAQHELEVAARRGRGAAEVPARPRQPSKLTRIPRGAKQALKADAHRPSTSGARPRRCLRRSGPTATPAATPASPTSSASGAVRRGDAANAFVPLTFELGEAFQFDWSEEGLVVGGIYYRATGLAHEAVRQSRAFWLVAYPSQGHEMLFDAHTRSFAALGGIARRASTTT